MTLWTIQPLPLYEKLMEQGVLHCDPNNKDFWGLECKEFRSAYDWLVEQMKSRVGFPPKGVQYPFWAWALIDGVNKKPDLRRIEFNNEQVKSVRKFTGRGRRPNADISQNII